MNSTLLRQVYKVHKIKKKFRWYKTPKVQNEDADRQAFITMKRLLT